MSTSSLFSSAVLRDSTSSIEKFLFLKTSEESKARDEIDWMLRKINEILSKLTKSYLTSYLRYKLSSAVADELLILKNQSQNFVEISIRLNTKT